MCGRFAVTTDPARLAVQLGALNETGLETGEAAPRYNIAPTTDIVTLVARQEDSEAPEDDDITRRLRLMRWGMVPQWMKQGARPLINARAETVTTSPAFRDAAKRKRCLVPMDGYYEWQAPRETSGSDNTTRGRKTPFYFSRTDGSSLLVAGLWSVWRPDPDSAGMLTCTVITTGAVGELASVHDRMPLILRERDWDRWLDPAEPAPADLLATPPDIADIAMREVSTLVNRIANNGPELIEPAGGGDQPVGLF